MPNNRAFDTEQPGSIAWPYDRVVRPLDTKTDRFIRGENFYVTWGGTAAKRPGVERLSGGDFEADYRIDRSWEYQTLDTPPKLFFVVSAYSFVNQVWELWYQRRTDTPGVWTQFPNLRACNESQRPHEACPSRGLLYIKGFPAHNEDPENLGSIIFDGSNEEFNLWGLLGPQEPIHINGAIATTTTTTSISATTINVGSTASFPAAPFSAQIEFELVNVTAKTATTFTVTRAAGGTEAVERPAGASIVYRNFSASDHAVTVNLFWGYTYSYKTNTGQVSNRSPIETNPDKMPSYTGPFSNLVPSMTYVGHADTTRVPTIVIQRTTDGGGTWFTLEEIANPGAGTHTYLDDSLESGVAGGTFDDPVPDALLNTFNPAPSLTSNSPPPTCLAPAVTGVDAIQASTPLVSYAGRIWYAIGNVLFYSGQEEVVEGIPEECFPSGVQGNFFRAQYPITNVQPTRDALYVPTLNDMQAVTGTNRETFSLRPIIENIGHPYGSPRAITRHENKVILLTQDFRVVLIQNQDVITLSDPLFTDIVDAANQGAEFDIKYWADLNNEWIIVGAYNTTIAERTKFWVLDMKRTTRTGEPFWFLPWTLPASSMISGRISEDTGQRRLVFCTYDSDENFNVLSKLDPTGRAATDDTAYGDGQPISWYFDTRQFQNPTGNHVNTYRMPSLNSTVHSVQFDRTMFPRATDPNVYCYFDDFWTNPIEQGIINPPPIREQSLGYQTSYVPVGQCCQHFAFRMSQYRSFGNFELQNFFVCWDPEAGA
jgi:hypothetical protein